MARRMIGQERFLFEASERKTDLDALCEVIDWSEVDRLMRAWE